MIKIRPSLSMCFLLLGCLSCSQSQNTNKEEYPDFKDRESIPATNTQVINEVHGPHFHRIEIRQMVFVPQELVVEKGDTVEWINHDITAHDVTEIEKKQWHSSPLRTGQSWQLIVVGSADYYCSIHVVMKGKLNVR